jgi:hypothetical protein
MGSLVSHAWHGTAAASVCIRVHRVLVTPANGSERMKRIMKSRFCCLSAGALDHRPPVCRWALASPKAVLHRTTAVCRLSGLAVEVGTGLPCARGVDGRRGSRHGIATAQREAVASISRRRWKSGWGGLEWMPAPPAFLAAAAGPAHSTVGGGRGGGGGGGSSPASLGGLGRGSGRHWMSPAGVGCLETGRRLMGCQERSLTQARPPSGAASWAKPFPLQWSESMV